MKLPLIAINREASDDIQIQTRAAVGIARALQHPCFPWNSRGPGTGK